MKSHMLAAAGVLAVACQSPASANPMITSAVESSRFDFVMTVSLAAGVTAPPLEGTIGTERFDLIVCNQGQATGHGVSNPPAPILIPAGECRALGAVKMLKLNAAPSDPWQAVIYGRFH
ncbi:MAG TPA: hypothetical protein VG889_19550 [Rhizomicrobium sp.]|nr:hypothetical protein [Rhizomicrobium sp.]